MDLTRRIFIGGSFWIVCAGALALLPVAKAQDVSLSLEGCPSAITGQAGEIKTFDVFAVLTTANNPSPDGAQAWQLSLTADGGTIKAISVGGLKVSTIFDDDGLEETPLLNPYLFDLADASFKNAQLATFPADGRKGAVSQVFLGQNQKAVLQPNGKERIAKVTVEVKVPAGTAAVPLTLRFEDGFKGSGLAIKNLATFDGVNFRASLGSCTIPVSPLPSFALNFEGLPAVITGSAGEVKTLDVYVTLKTENNTAAYGAQAWQLSLTAEGGRIKSIGVDGVTVFTIFDDDGLPETPPKNPYSFDLANADFKSSQLATYPTDGRKGAISTVFLGQQELNVLQPNGTARIAKLTLEVTIPAASVPASLKLRFEDGFQGSGLPLKNLATIDGVNYRPSLFSSSAVVSPLPTVALGFEGCPSVVSGQAGEVKTFDVFATLSTSTNVDTEGAQAWQLSLTADGGRIKAITVDGVMVSTIFDDDGLPETPPKNPYSFDLANADFKSSQLATFPTDGRKGAISTIFLGQQELNVLQPNGTARLAKVTVEVTIPSGAVTAPLALRYEDGFKGSGLPLKNVVTFDGVNYRPTLTSCSATLSPLPTLALGFEGCPSQVSGQPGQVKTFDVFATLSTSTNIDPEGAQAWQLSLTADGGRIKAITVDGVMVSTIFDDDGLPETPPRNPYSFDLANADFKSSQLATFPGDGRKGAISTVFLGQQELNVLQPNGTARLAKVTVEATLPAGPAPATLTLRFEDGFKGSGLPLKNVATFEGVNYRPVLGSCAVDLSASTSNLILPGDCNSDAKIDISDGICLLGYLFTGQTPDLPCDDAGAPTPGSLALMNFNGDAGGLDVTDAIAIFGYLFLGGGPHALGEECRGIAGCPAACQ